VRGPERAIHRIGRGDVRVEVDLKKVRPGSRTFDLTTEHVQVPEELEVVQIIPGQFQLTFDDRLVRTIDVHPRVVGNFAEGMQVARLIANPPSIAIVGPKRRVDAIEAATTDPVDASGTMDRATFITHAYVPDPMIQVVHPTPIRVTVIMGRSGDEIKTQ